jgi:hypothetical protein
MSGAYKLTSNQFNLLYSFNNVTIGASGSTGSTAIDVSRYATKSAYGYIGTTQVASGSLVVSGSIDGTNYYSLQSGSSNSGSLITKTFTDAVRTVKVYLYNNVTGSVISGSVFLAAY